MQMIVSEEAVVSESILALWLPNRPPSSTVVPGLEAFYMSQLGVPLGQLCLRLVL